MKKSSQLTKKKYGTKAVLRTMFVMGILTALYSAVPGAFASSASQAITESGKAICLFIGVAVALIAVAEIVGGMSIDI